MARPKGGKDRHGRAPYPRKHKTGATGGWGTFEACSLGGMASLIARRQEEFFARRREAWAAQVARVLA